MAGRQTRVLQRQPWHHAERAPVGFDAEFPAKDVGDVCRLRLKNLNNLLHFEVADAGISPTHWQASTFPQPFRSQITVVHDGIDTVELAPNPAVSLTLNGHLTLTRQDEVITFVNRNLEPYRGYHVFMRALPEILKRRPNARVLIVGGDDVSYGARPTPILININPILCSTVQYIPDLKCTYQTLLKTTNVFSIAA